MAILEIPSTGRFIPSMGSRRPGRAHLAGKIGDGELLRGNPFVVGWLEDFVRDSRSIHGQDIQNRVTVHGANIDMVQKSLVLGNGCHRHSRWRHAGVAIPIPIAIAKWGGISAGGMRGVTVRCYPQLTMPKHRMNRKDAKGAKVREGQVWRRWFSACLYALNAVAVNVFKSVADSSVSQGYVFGMGCARLTLIIHYNILNIGKEHQAWEIY